MNNHVILVGGKKRVGKNTSVDIIEDYLKQKRINVVRESFAGVLKDITCMLLEVTPRELDILKNSGGVVKSVTEDGQFISGVTHRKFLQVLGTDVRDRYFNKCLWVDMCLDRIKNIPENTVVIIDDWRFPHESERVATKFSTTEIIIERPKLPQGDLHPSETALDEFDAVRIINDGTIGDLRLKIYQELERIL